MPQQILVNTPIQYNDTKLIRYLLRFLRGRSFKNSSFYLNKLFIYSSPFHIITTIEIQKLIKVCMFDFYLDLKPDLVRVTYFQSPWFPVDDN